MTKLWNLNKAKPLLLTASLMIVIVLLIAVAALTRDPVAQTDAVSPALNVLAQRNSMAMAGLKGSAIEFASEDFARAMNLSHVSEVTITSVPPTTDGTLRLGSTVVHRGQTVSASKLSLLTYEASSAEIATSSFQFRVNGSPVDVTCHLYLLERVNSAPTLDMVPKTSLNVSTHRNVTLYGTLPCHDPDGDATLIEIVSYPKTGLLVLTDPLTGTYTYTPGENLSGKESFTYVARDTYGNYSAAATVSLSVVKPSTSVVYADLGEHPCHHAALTMTEAGIMSGTQVGSSVYFYPEKTVTRGEFLVWAMNAMGMTEVTPSEATVFADDSDIPGTMKGYVTAAYELNYIKGEPAENGTLCFYPNRAITRAEAAVILGSMLNAATPTVTPMFSDSSEIPAFAVSSVYSMNAMGILSANGGSISPRSAVTRGEAAQMLTALMTVKK